MKISREDVLRVAELAYLDLTESEVATYQQQLDSILEYAGKLNELDTANVAPMAQVLADNPCVTESALREDVIVPCWAATEILGQAPDAKAPYFRVPKVIDR